MKTTSMIGLGYIGLPTAALLASKNVKVNGIDINIKRLNDIEAGKIDKKEKGLKEIVRSSILNGNLKLSSSYVKSDIYVIAVPTPFFLKSKKANLKFIKRSIESIAPLLKKVI